VITTTRLRLRRLTEADAPFIVRVLNEPSFIQNIGDRGVRTVADAETYLRMGPLTSYDRHGFGLYLVELRETMAPIGICGLLKRDELEDVDVGFSLLPAYWSRGYAFEAAAAVMAHAREAFGLQRLVAITAIHNERSGRLLGRLGFAFERTIRLGAAGEELKLFAAG
jgi:RimJ/RimL family protein N-acetyltransferase